ncbi:MAG: EAL domain-containing protein [Hyphomicrobiaceae bacterium]
MRAGVWARARVCLGLLVAMLLTLAGTLPARALEPIVIGADQDRIDITNLGVIYEGGRGDRIQVETAPGVDGVAGRIIVRATTPGTSPGWLVFALRNPTDKTIERWVTADRYNLAGSGIIWPDLDARRVAALTASHGFVPERIASDGVDVFRITVEPGQTVTYVAELSAERFSRIYLWNARAYEMRQRNRTLFNGILLGLTALLAIFVTSIFAANHKAMFPSAALVAWCVLAYLCVDFGFWHKLFQLRADANAIYRASAEAAIAASLVIFLHTFLHLRSWHPTVRFMIGIWMLAQLALVALAIVDPRLAATFARISLGFIGVVGALFILYLALRGQDRALSLVPTWLLLVVWLFGCFVTVSGRLSGDVVVSGAVAALVLITILIGFTVTQFAFRSTDPLYGLSPGDAQLAALAVDGAGAAVWEWNDRREEVRCSPILEESLGLTPGELSTKVDDWLEHVHPGDRERFRLLLWSLKENSGGLIKIDFRLRRSDGTYRWFELEGASVEQSERRALKCVGILKDVTSIKRAQERLVHDAVHDSLTGLPNRELFLDRLGQALARSRSDNGARPTALFIDIDRFKSVNSTFGLIVGDSLLLTVARRLSRHLGPHDTLARVGGDQFAILLTDQHDARQIALLAERIRRALRSPLKISGREVVLTGSIGIAVHDGQDAAHENLLREAEIAAFRAKRAGMDRIEIFKPSMRRESDEHVLLEQDLRRALERRQLRVLYQPIMLLGTEELAGFEALLRWEHPKLGMLNAAEFIPIAEQSDLILKLGAFVLERATFDLVRWHKELPRVENALFVSVNVSSRQLFRPELVQDVRRLLGREIVPRGCLKLEITESLVMENPEQAVEVLGWLRDAGVGLALDDFGTGYSSLAYLERFPFDTIKIDRALVQAAFESESGPVIVRSIVALSHELGKAVVAEGVETSEDVSFLRSIGCELAQGHYYGAAISDKDVIAGLKSMRKSDRRVNRGGFFGGKPKTRKPKGSRDDGDVPAPEPGGGPPPPPPAGVAAAANGHGGPSGAVDAEMVAVGDAIVAAAGTPAHPERSHAGRPPGRDRVREPRPPVPPAGDGGMSASSGPMAAPLAPPPAAHRPGPNGGPVPGPSAVRPGPVEHPRQAEAAAAPHSPSPAESMPARHQPPPAEPPRQGRPPLRSVDESDDPPTEEPTVPLARRRSPEGAAQPLPRPTPAPSAGPAVARAPMEPPPARHGAPAGENDGPRGETGPRPAAPTPPQPRPASAEATEARAPRQQDASPPAPTLPAEPEPSTLSGIGAVANSVEARGVEPVAPPPAAETGAPQQQAAPQPQLPQQPVVPQPSLPPGASQRSRRAGT